MNNAKFGAMNPSIAKLAELAQKPSRKIIGLMSGTSLDGLDIALCECRGAGAATQVKVLEFVTKGYAVDFREAVKKVFAKRDADLQEVCLLNEVIAITHADLIKEALQDWGIAAAEIDLIASHGQTIFHAPRILHGMDGYPNGTLQIGDGDHLAVHTGIITLSDFRQKHIAAGGEGAPLAVYGDYLIFSAAGEDRIMLNIGGIANFTFLPGDRDASRVFSTDVGPGNTIMDHFVQQHYPGQYYDRDAQLALSGTVNAQLLAALLDEAFFSAALPKTTGPELFSINYLKVAQERSVTVDLPPQDVMATLCHFTAQAIIGAIRQTIHHMHHPVIYMSGGGMHNPLLVQLLKTGVPEARFATTADLRVNPDAKEAVLFALLANETVAGKPISFGDRRGVPSVCMGKISLPE